MSYQSFTGKANKLLEESRASISKRRVGKISHSFTHEKDISRSIFDEILSNPDCPLWYMGIFCPSGYDKYVTHMEEATYRLNKNMYALNKPLGNEYAWGRGRIHCTWPDLATEGLNGPSEKIELQKFDSKNSSKGSRDANFLKILNSIHNPEKQKRVMAVIIEDAHSCYHPDGSMDEDFFYNIFGKYKGKSPVSFGDNIFRHLELIYNIIFELSGLTFDREDITKTDHFQKTDNFNQLNVMIKYYYWDKHVARAKGQNQQTPVQPSRKSYPVKLAENSETPYQCLKNENRGKQPPCATLLVACGMLPQFGAGYGAVKNWGIELPNTIHRYMAENVEDRVKMDSKCRLQHHVIMDNCFKIGLDRQCPYQVAYDISFWQVSHLADQPDFSKWTDSRKLPWMSATGFDEEKINQYPEVRYDRSMLLFNESKCFNIFYTLVCEVADSLFDTFPEFNDPKFLDCLLNNKEPTGNEIRKLNDILQQNIKDNAKLFQNYLFHFQDIYDDMDTSSELARLLSSLPSKSINSCTIVKNIFDSSRELYEVKIDNYMNVIQNTCENTTFELRLFPARFKRHSLGDFNYMKACIPEFKYELDFFDQLSGYERAGELYDYGKLEYTDEYGNKRVKLFILAEKTYGREPDYDDENDKELIRDAFKRISKHIIWKRKQEMDNSDVFALKRAKLHIFNSLARELAADFPDSVSVMEKMGFRIIDEEYAKCFGRSTTTESLSRDTYYGLYDFSDKMKAGLAPEYT